jgi:hypothetical protein
MLSPRPDGDDDPAAGSRPRGPALVRLALAGSLVAGLIITFSTGVGSGAPVGGSIGLVSGAASGPSLQLVSASIPVGHDPSFPISGSVEGLAPGVRSRLAVTISNPFEFPIRIIQLIVVVGDSPGNCSGKDLEIEPFRGPLQVSARGRTTTYLGVTLSRRSPDVCQAATWRLIYRGQAVMVNASGGAGTSPPLAEPGAVSPKSSGSGLPVTGLALSVLIAVAAVLLAGGAAILLAQRRRSASSHPAHDSRAQ